MNDFSYEMLDLLKKYDGDTEAALAGETSPQCLYAFSRLRENLFEWVEIGKDQTVLQIGSDYGSFTGVLAERAGMVTVLDPRDENLEVNKRRHGTRENIKYVRGDMFQADVIVGQNYDYVILIGGAGLFEKEQAEAALLSASAFVKDGGVLMMPAENASGIRYWMGAECPEFSFLEVEFRGMFEKLKEKSGGSYTMYYPVPDYRYPVTLYSDRYLPQTGDMKNISARYDGPGYRFGSEEKAMAKVCRNGEFTKFANSFLGVWEKGKA